MISSPYTTKQERGPYSANVYIDGDTIVAVDGVGTVIKEGTAAVVLQAAVNAAKDVFFAEGTYDIGSTTITLQDKDMSIDGVGKNAIIKGSADPLIDVTLGNEYQLRANRVGIHTTSTNKGIHIDNCTGRLPIWLDNIHFVPEGHAGVLVYIKGIANTHISNCSFQDTNAATTAKGIYITADNTIFSQEFYMNACSFMHMNYGVQCYAASADRAHLAGIHIAGSYFYGIDNPVHCKCTDDITIVECTVESQQTGNEKSLVFDDCINCRIVGNRLSTRSTGAQIEFLGTALDCYMNTVSANYIYSYGKQGNCVLLDSSPGDKYVDAEVSGNIIHNGISGVQATKGATYTPVLIFEGNHLRYCTDNIKGDIAHSIILGNIWGAGCSSTAVNGTYGTSEIVHNHKT